MKFLSVHHTDVGIKKKTNQDSLCIKTAESSFGDIAFCIVCDGIGGLARGEIASEVVVSEFASWFDTTLPQLLNKGINLEILKQNWASLISESNEKLQSYGRKCGVSLGTTATAILFVMDKYYIAHVGDCRVYEIEKSTRQLTRDQTVVGREVECGNLSLEEALTDPRRNILLQCIGASQVVTPDYIEGAIKQNCLYMLCSDGFRHELSDREIYDEFRYDLLLDENVMKQKAIKLVELAKARKEPDNITVILLKTISSEEKKEC